MAISPSKPLRLALCGVGLVGQRHAKAIQESDHARLITIADPAPTGEEFAAASGAEYYNDTLEMLDAAMPDGVIIATPNESHVELAMACIERSLPILVEKPIAVTSQDADLIVAASAKANVPVLVGHHRRHNPRVVAAKHCIDSGELGRITMVHGNFWLYKPDSYFSTVPWHRENGAGPILINLIHDIDLLRYLVGEVASVHGITSNAARGNPVEDSAAVLLRFANGALGTFSVSDHVVAPWSWELTAEENPVYPKTDAFAYLFGGSHGSLEFPRMIVWQQQTKRSWYEPINHRQIQCVEMNTLVEQIRHFCDVIIGRTEPVVSAAEATRSLRVLEAIHDSATHAGATRQLNFPD